jgi:hypothetical protein
MPQTFAPLRRSRRVVCCLAAATALAGCSGGSAGTDASHGAAATRAGAAISPGTAAPTASTGPSAAASVSPAVRAGTPCGGLGTPKIRHVVWIWMENRTYSSVLGSGTAAPRLAAYARSCGLATAYAAVTHPSLPNYLAATSGSTGGVTSDCGPSQCPQNRASLFGQVSAAGLQWRTYAEAMPTACNRVSQGRYATKHNPAVYFLPVRAQCGRWDVPFGGTSGAFATALAHGLPAFGFVEPDLCDDGHDCTTAHADAWLGGTLDRLTRSPSYARGDVAVFVTWDEGVGAQQRVATVVIAPSVPRGIRSAVAFSHYSLLRTTEALLRLPLLGAARSAHDMRSAFRLTGA